MIRDAERLRRLLGAPAWAWWRRRAWDELAARRGLPATWVLAHPSAAEREAANRLLSTPGAIGAVRLRAAELTALLEQAAIADDLRECVIALEGPLPEPDSDTPRWREVLAEAARILPAERLRGLLRLGGLRRLAAGDPEVGAQFVAQAATVIARLGRPASLAELAVRATGDAHALDRDRALGRLLARLLGATEDVRSWRQAWAAAGITTDELSSDALVLNAGFAGTGLLARLAAQARGEPLRFTLRQLRDPAPLVLPGNRLLVCENPAVVARAAECLGADCPTLLATGGWPSLAALDLLDRAAAAGGTIAIHADLDWAGLAIAGELLRRDAAQPWRMSAEELRRHAAVPGAPLIGTPVATPWDPDLAAALAERGSALHEEAVLEDLLADLWAGTQGAVKPAPAGH